MAGKRNAHVPVNDAKNLPATYSATFTFSSYPKTQKISKDRTGYLETTKNTSLMHALNVGRIHKCTLEGYMIMYTV